MDAIKKTLTPEDRKYVQFDKDGNIDRSLINSRQSESGNFSNLKELVNSEIVVEYSVSNVITFKRNGETVVESMGEIIKGEDGTYIAGLKGRTLVPEPERMLSSNNENVQVTTNEQLDENSRAENVSHELFGHALLYVKNPADKTGWTHNRTSIRTDGNGTTILIDGNQNLKNAIRKSTDETIQNMNK